LVNFFVHMVRDRALAEDLPQEVFLRVYQARQRYQPEWVRNRLAFHWWRYSIPRWARLKIYARRERQRHTPIRKERRNRGKVRHAGLTRTLMLRDSSTGCANCPPEEQ
jgi:DNA-directed RNA polymerase specialized sigma24 family protein